MPNTFRNPEQLQAYKEAMFAYLTGTGFLPTHFWQGFEGIKQPEDWDKSAKLTMPYAYWRAGRDAAKLTKKKGT